MAFLSTHGDQQLDPSVCQRARAARDPRFDGEFFVAVTSTGIYCRPVCPAKLPAERNVRYFRFAAQAADAGFRPCLRCRPETAPRSPAWMGSTTTVARALRLITEGALDGDGSVTGLAGRLGVGARYLNKLFQRELGVSPTSIAGNQRLLLARQLIVETQLPLTDIAFASGFSSVRRFNSAIRDAFASAPGALRRRSAAHALGHNAAGRIRLELRYRPPYDWNGVLAFFARHAVEGVESVQGDSYTRCIDTHQGIGHLRLSPLHPRSALQLELTVPAGTPLLPIVSRVRRFCDLDANPAAIAAVLCEDTVLAPLLTRSPGVRCPGYWDAGEAAVRAVVGQQISTAGARSICAALVRELVRESAHAGNDACESGVTAPFPRPEALLSLGDEHFPMPTRRRETLRAVARACLDNDDACIPEQLLALKGIGPWTAEMVALRGWGHPDAFPASDLGLLQAWEALGKQRNPTSLARHAERWRPYRGYAANLLWRSL